MEEKKAAIIVPFVSVNDYVIECIRGCLSLSYSDFDLILLPDNEIKLPKELDDKRIKIIVTGTVTISKKRNMGISKFPKADFYAFIDSDSYPHKDWLKNGIKAFSKSQGIWAVGGPNICPINESFYKKVVGNALKSFLVSGARSYRKKIVKNRYCIDLPTCNLIVKKEAVAALKGFNENLITGEDIEFCNRLIGKKKKIFYDNTVIVYHHNRQLFMPFILQRITYGLSVFKCLKEKPTLSNFFLLAPFTFLLFLFFGLISAIFNQIIRIIWLSVITFYLLVVLIETIRYSTRLKEIPLTFVAIILGNITPGIGSLMALLGMKIDVRKIYRNY